ncbi:MAG TPA: hypothetical protein VHD34_11440 [Xanthobacteraceae bacterium]|nr:hypothetical protein [Xanthobacteraceae bacterium]
MESGFKAEDAKPADNTALYLVLGLCYSGLFFMIVAGATLAAALAFGNKIFNADLTYLLAVSFYLGLVVAALIGASFSYAEPDERRKMAAAIRTRRAR